MGGGNDENPWPAPDASLAGARILIVEDHVDCQLLMNHVLSRTGADIRLSGNGESVIDDILSGAFDLVLLDVQIPNMNGFKVVELLRRHGYEGPIVAVTAMAMGGHREACLQAGFSDYLSKPFTGTALAQATMKALRDWAARSAKRDTSVSAPAPGQRPAQNSPWYLNY